MKKKFVLGLFFILFSFSFVVAATCDNSQTIMRLYGSDNSHVSAWNIPTYTQQICYDDIFGFKYIGQNPHECNSFNRVLSLYSPDNSHASEIFDANNYNYNVCYGNLKCDYENSVGDSCVNSGKVIARLYAPTNSHVSIASDNNYKIKVCCHPIGPPYWADMSGNKINKADFGDIVLLVSPYVPVSTSFNIKEHNAILPDDEIKSVDAKLVGSELVGTWTITKQDLDKTGDYNEFYFNSGSFKSNYLAINTAANDSPMNIALLSPDCGSHFDIGTNVNISVSALDIDDTISGNVSVNNNIIGTFQNGLTNITKVFNVPGNFHIVVDAKNARGRKSRANSNIMILDKENGEYVDGEYVAACISKPEDLSNIKGNVVDFDASTTRGVSVVNGILHELIPGENKFSWYWKFMPENMVREFINTTDLIAYKFPAEFPIAGDNSATLRVQID